MKAALDLLTTAVEAGWTVKIAPAKDTGGSPFVTVEGISLAGAYFSATWHTRATGSYRLFQSNLGTSKRSMRQVSLKAIRAAIKAAA